jgi:hypothetical protein
MKKKDFKQKLQLRKRIISNLDSNKVQGGTNKTTYPVIVTIRLTAQLTTFMTKPQVCETHGDVCTLYCETKGLCN